MVCPEPGHSILTGSNVCVCSFLPVPGNLVFSFHFGIILYLDCMTHAPLFLGLIPHSTKMLDLLSAVYLHDRRVVLTHEIDATCIDLVSATLKAFQAQGATRSQLVAECGRLVTDEVYFDKWVRHLPDWHSDAYLLAVDSTNTLPFSSLSL